MLKNHKTNRNLRPAFTLVELLLVIAIISVLATMAVGVMRQAQDDAKASATESRILQLESLFQVALEDYEVRRLPIRRRTLLAYVDGNPFILPSGDRQERFLQLRDLRRRILQDIINMEMPRPFIDPMGNFLANDDVARFPSENPAAVTSGGVGFARWLDDNYGDPPAGGGPLLRDFLRTLRPARVQSFGPFKNGAGFTDPEFNLPGEYVHAILSRMDVDGTPAIELLGNSAVGNSDDDDFPEVVDAWGDPLQLRIWQVNVMEPMPNDAVFEDMAPLDFDTVDAAGAPIGYAGLDSTVPREVQQLRFEVISTRLGR